MDLIKLRIHKEHTLQIHRYVWPEVNIINEYAKMPQDDGNVDKKIRGLALLAAE